MRCRELNSLNYSLLTVYVYIYLFIFIYFYLLILLNLLVSSYYSTRTCRVSWLFTFSKSANWANCLNLHSPLIVYIFKVSWLFIFQSQLMVSIFKVNWFVNEYARNWFCQEFVSRQMEGGWNLDPYKCERQAHCT